MMINQGFQPNVPQIETQIAGVSRRVASVREANYGSLSRLYALISRLHGAEMATLTGQQAPKAVPAGEMGALEEVVGELEANAIAVSTAIDKLESL